MQRKILSFFAFVVCVIACSKDKLETIPSLKLKSISSATIPVNGAMNIALEFTDKEGTGDTIYLFKIRNNLNATATIRDTIPYLVPTFPNNSKGEMDLQLTYSADLVSAIAPPLVPPSTTEKESDSLTFKLILKDAANHTSDTVVIKNIVVQRT